jgi:hypothetical protein
MPSSASAHLPWLALSPLFLKPWVGLLLSNLPLLSYFLIVRVFYLYLFECVEWISGLVGLSLPFRLCPRSIEIPFLVTLIPDILFPQNRILFLLLLLIQGNSYLLVEKLSYPSYYYPLDLAYA